MYKTIMGVMMISSLAAAEPTSKVIVVGEKIVKENPWRNGLIKKQYAIAIDQALKEHKEKHPQSTVRVIESFDEGPTQGFALAEKEKALGVAGYLYSTESFEASQIASSKKIPFLTPVSPLSSIRNEYAYSMAASHDDLKESFKALSKKLGSRSIIVMPETFLPNYEYERLFREVFDVVETYRGSSAQVWPKLKDNLPALTKIGPINILFAGFAFEQIDLVKFISESSFAEKVHLIGNSQWGYNEVFLQATLPGTMKNFIVVSDYIDVAKLVPQGFPHSKDSIAVHGKLRTELQSTPKVDGHIIDEPIVYVLKDMITLVLDAAEKSSSREEFNKKYSTLDLEGASGVLKAENKKTHRKVYLERWKDKKFIPEAIL